MDDLQIPPKYCMGCECCINICPNNAIQKEYDFRGFLHPKIDEQQCKKCNLCLERCPIIKFVTSNETLECYAAQATDEIRLKSTSGGIFSVIAKHIFDEGGVVFGALWDNSFKVYIGHITKIEDLDLMRHSKYVKSETRSSYTDVKKFLEQGKKVLYSGLPCEIAGLNAYLGKKYPNLLTIDVICGQAPSGRAFSSYLEEKQQLKKITNVIFRNDSHWNPHTHDIFYEDGTVERCSQWKGNAYQRAYRSTLMAPDSCKYCSFNKLPRTGDITIGDFWGIKTIDSSLDDNRGTSICIINSEIGKEEFDKIYAELKIATKVPLDKLPQLPNRINNCDALYFLPSDQRDEFYKNLNNYSFSKAVDYTLKEKIDVGIVAALNYNYGGNLTYFALYKVLEKIGLTASFIDRRIDAPSPPHKNPYCMFRTNPYPTSAIIQPSKDYKEINELNKTFEKFILGSDQMLNPRFIEKFGYHTCLDWVHGDKIKIAYAASFGKEIFDEDEKLTEETKILLQRFNAFSVREYSAKEILDKTFDIKSEVVLDPVFLCDKQNYVDLVERSITHSMEKRYIGVYLLDPSEGKSRLISEISKIKKLSPYIIGDSYISTEKYAQFGINVCSDAKVEDWLYNVYNCTYFITDSFHGACFAMIFNKPFTLIINKYRGKTRIDTLSTIFPISSRVIDEDSKIYPSALSNINYDTINDIIDKRKTECEKWLTDALKLTPTGHYPDNVDTKIQTIIKNAETCNSLSKITNTDEELFKKIDLLMNSKNKDDNEEAFTICLTKFMGGIKTAGKLSIMYKKGIGTQADLNKCEYCLRIAAYQNSDWAKVELVDLLMNSNSKVKQKEAFDLCNQYIENGCKKLYGKLYVMYHQGIGVTSNNELASSYLDMAIQEGSEWAKNEKNRKNKQNVD